MVKDMNFKFVLPSIYSKNGVLRYGHFGEFLEFFGDRMTHLSLIDFKLSLYIKVNVNAGQNKFEVHISNHGPKWPLVGTK